MIEKYINYLRQVRALSPRTCEEYEKELRTFATWARPMGLRWSTISKQDIDAHVCDLHNRELMPSTIRKRITAIRSFYRWMRNEGYLETNPAQYCQSPKLAYTLPQSANVEDIDRYLQTAPMNVVDATTHCAVAIMLETGMRLSELLNLHTEDFTKSNHSIRIKGKGNKERIVYYSQRTANALNTYKRDTHGAIFAGITDVAMRFAMYRYCGQYAKRIHPHMLRHTFAMTMLNRGMDLKTLSQLLGHSSIQITERYARATQTQVEKMYNQTQF